jgi:hypothetical protein
VTCDLHSLFFFVLAHNIFLLKIQGSAEEAAEKTVTMYICYRVLKLTNQVVAVDPREFSGWSFPKTQG